MSKFKSIIIYITSTCLSIIITGCSSITSSYLHDFDFEKQSNFKSEVKYHTKHTGRSAVRLGDIIVKGNGCSNFDDLTFKAKQEAQKVGGDYIFLEDSGVETYNVKIPEHSSFTLKNGVSTAQSKGATEYNTNYPWGVYSVWIYTPSILGIKYQDKDWIIKGFKLNSDAELSGLMEGDEVIGIGGIDIEDTIKLKNKFMNTYVGEKIKISVKRNNQRYDFDIITMPND